MALPRFPKTVFVLSALLLAGLVPAAAEAGPFENTRAMNETALSAAVSGVRIGASTLRAGTSAGAPAAQSAGSGVNIRTGDITAEISELSGVTAVTMNSGIASQNTSISINMSINGIEVPDAAMGALF